LEYYLLPFFIIPLIFSIRRIIKGNLSRTEWVLYYIPILAAIVGFYLAMSPQFKNEEYSLRNFLILAIVFFVTPIVVGVIIPKYLSSKSVVKKFKNSAISEGKIQDFSYRKQIDLEEYLGTAEQEIIFISITHEIFTRDYIDIVEKYLFGNIKIKIILLNPFSEYIKEKSTLFIIEEEELRKGIHDTLKKLCDFKNNLTHNKENFSVLTHNYNIPESMIIIDSNDEYTNKKSSIKTEKYENSSDYNSRRSQVVFLKDNGFNYTEIYNRYKLIRKTITPYC
jgi:hypothetical protein